MLVVAPRWKLWKLAGITAVTLGTLLAGAGAQAARPREVRLGPAPLRPLQSHVLGRLSADTPLAVLVTLKPQNGLTAYAKATTTPGSGLYHRYLTVRQFRKRFGASQTVVRAVTDALRASGLSPGRVSANGLTIAVRASTSTFSRAFNTSFVRVRLPSGRVAFTNTSAPQLSANASPHIQAILGLNSLNPPLSSDLASGGALSRSSSHSVRSHTSATGGAVTPCPAIGEGAVTYGQNGWAGGWTADEVSAAYGFDGYYASADEGADQTIALLELEPNVPSDITTYEQCYGLSGAPPTVNYVPVDGGAGTGSGVGEAALDIEQVVGLAPQATVDVYQAPDDETNTGFVAALQAMIDNPAVNIISDSWGSCEPEDEGSTGNNYTDLTSENVLFEQAATEGKTVFAASGDDGSSGCYAVNSNSDSAPAVDDPASQPYVTGTGGTILPSTQSNDEVPAPASQTVWNDGAQSQGGASGGGISSYWPMPTWQTDAAPALAVIGPDSSGTPCRAASGDYCREVPDVSANGDPATGYAIFCSETCATAKGQPYSGQWFALGGTSAVAPLWAAYTALVNNSSACNRSPIGFANPLLYAAADSAYATDFNDVSLPGNNDFTASGYAGGLYPVAAGYDMATGLGSPIGGALGDTLCDEADMVTLSEPPAQTTTVGVRVNLALTASDSEDHGISGFSATGLPPGLSIEPTTGAITGAPTRGGRYNVAVTATAALTGAQMTKSFSWQVIALATTKVVKLRLGDKLLTITTPIQAGCAAPSSVYRVRFQMTPGSGNVKVTFKSVGYYLDKGIKRTRTETSIRHGEKHHKRVTVYLPNASSTHTSSSASLHLRGLKRGSHTLRLLITYTKTAVTAGRRTTRTAAKTVAHKFTVC
jgi:hypothetical protein